MHLPFYKLPWLLRRLFDRFWSVCPPSLAPHLFRLRLSCYPFPLCTRLEAKIWFERNWWLFYWEPFHLGRWLLTLSPSPFLRYFLPGYLYLFFLLSLCWWDPFGLVGPALRETVVAYVALWLDWLAPPFGWAMGVGRSLPTAVSAGSIFSLPPIYHYPYYYNGCWLWLGLLVGSPLLLLAYPEVERAWGWIRTGQASLEKWEPNLAPFPPGFLLVKHFHEKGWMHTLYLESADMNSTFEPVLEQWQWAFIRQWLWLYAYVAFGGGNALWFSLRVLLSPFLLPLLPLVLAIRLCRRPLRFLLRQLMRVVVVLMDLLGRLAYLPAGYVAPMVEHAIYQSRLRWRRGLDRFQTKAIERTYRFYLDDILDHEWDHIHWEGTVEDAYYRYRYLFHLPRILRLWRRLLLPIRLSPLFLPLALLLLALGQVVCWVVQGVLWIGAGCRWLVLHEVALLLRRFPPPWRFQLVAFWRDLGRWWRIGGHPRLLRLWAGALGRWAHRRWFFSRFGPVGRSYDRSLHLMAFLRYLRFRFRYLRFRFRLRRRFWLRTVAGWLAAFGRRRRQRVAAYSFRQWFWPRHWAWYWQAPFAVPLLLWVYVSPAGWQWLVHQLPHHPVFHFFWMVVPLVVIPYLSLEDFRLWSYWGKREFQLLCVAFYACYWVFLIPPVLPLPADPTVEVPRYLLHHVWPPLRELGSFLLPSLLEQPLWLLEPLAAGVTAAWVTAAAAVAALGQPLASLPVLCSPLALLLLWWIRGWEGMEGLLGPPLAALAAWSPPPFPVASVRWFLRVLFNQPTLLLLVAMDRWMPLAAPGVPPWLDRCCSLYPLFGIFQ